MTVFNVTTIRPKGFLHSSAFSEVKESLCWALAALGHEAVPTENAFSTTGTNIIFGAELLDANSPLPANAIPYNLEQPSHPRMEIVRALAKGRRVWDFSLRNVERWRQDGFDVRHVPIGYTPNLTRIPKAAIQDIDVCFFGWMTSRRHLLISDIRAAGLNVFTSDKCYGGARDNIISRSKVCLNIHHNGRDMFEIVRVSYLLANGKAVVSETSSDYDSYTSPPIYLSDYAHLVDTCKAVVAGNVGREETKRNALAWSKEQDYVATVAAALAGPKFEHVEYGVKLTDKGFENLSGGGPLRSDAIQRRYDAGCHEGDMSAFLPFLRAHAHGNILEIGVRGGASTSALLLGLEASGGHLYSIDIRDCSHLWTHPQWTFTQRDSHDIPPRPTPEFDLILIDGDHSRDGFRSDLRKFYQSLKPGGILCCHDICPEPGQTFEDAGGDYPSVAIREEYFAFIAEHGLKHEELPGRYGMGVIHKP